MTETFESLPETSDRAAGAGQSPLETFILDEVEPQRDALNEWTSLRSHTSILLHTADGRRLHSQRIGGKESRSFTLSRSGVQLGGIDGNVTTLVSHQALRAAQSLELTRQCLALSDIPHLASRTFHVSQYKSASAFARDAGHSLNLKPTSDSGQSDSGQGGATSNLTTEEAFDTAWDRAVAACSELPVPRQHIDVAIFLPWIPLRVFVVGEEAVSAVARVPLYIVGDGQQTAQQLADNELQRRTECKYLEPVPDRTAWGLTEALPVDPGTVLERGQLHVLTHDQGGQSGTGWSVDVTERISSDLATLAVNATWAFPGLGASAVDILTPALTSENQAVVAGLDPAANLREFRYPAYGQPRYPNLDIMKRIASQDRP